MQVARKQYPDAYAQFQKSAGPAPHDRIGTFVPLGPENARKAKDQFTSAVREIAANSGCSTMQAMTKARQMYPSLYRAYQGEENR